MATILDKIAAYKRDEVAAAKTQRPAAAVDAEARKQPAPRGFANALKAKHAAGDWALIAEIKKASPSAGLIRPDFDPVAIARTYHACGASALSVLTDRTYFQGDLDYIRQVRDAVPLPVLRKDFIIDEYQVYESRAAGADAILLIAEVLNDQQIMDLLILAAELNLTTLLEAHEADEVLRIRSVIGFPHRRYSLLGINNRDLQTFRTELEVGIRLARRIPKGITVVSESGIEGRRDIERLMEAGIHAFLVGESLMREADIGRKLRELLGHE